MARPFLRRIVFESRAGKRPAVAVAASTAALSVNLLQAAPAFAHASDRGHVLLLPTGYYLVGGGLAVAVSFLVLLALPAQVLDRFWRRSLPLVPLPDVGRTAVSLVCLAGFAVLVAAGFWGSRDPLSNPLPLTVWTLMWAGLVLVQGLLGNVWSWLNPWYGLHRLALAAGMAGKPAKPAASLSGIGCWPAFVLFLAFAWFELVDPAPDDPARLATAAGAYWLLSFVLMLIFGYDRWTRQGEFLTLFFSMLSRFSVLERTATGRLALCWPGSKLLAEEPLPPSGVAFLLLALSSVSFDGLSRTFFWLALNGVNPLEFPGRTAVMGIGTAGLALTFIGLAALFGLAVRLGQRIARDGGGFRRLAGLMVWSIVPIAFAYHVAHYLPSLLTDGQYAIAALSDPFARGWNLFGTAGMEIEAGIVSGAESAWWLWNIEAGIIVVGHVLAVLVAHALSARLYGSPGRALLGQLPLAALMVGYTVFGLWLLATPTVG
jgi:hypothetical protein